MNILICEDHTILMQSMKSYLQKSLTGSVIFEAKNGEQALEILGTKPMDVVLLDLSMPGGMHGFEVLEKINRQWPAVKVIILSADAYELSAVKAIRNGAWSYLNKDVEMEVLIDAIKSVVAGKKYILPEVLELLSNPQISPVPEELHKDLTDREYEVMILLAKERSYIQISKKLNMSTNNVGTHRTNLMLKMKMKKNSELVNYCRINHLI